MKTTIKHFHSFDTLRLLFATIITLAHVSSWEETVPNGGLGVDYFFQLSGFLLAYSFIHKQKQSYSHFVLHKIARFFPVYFASLATILALTFCINGVFPSTWEFSKNALLLQNIICSPFLGMNHPAWAISSQFWISISIFFLVLKYRNIPAAITLALICFVQIQKLGYSIDNSHGHDVWITTAGVYRCVYDMTIGYLLLELYLYLQKTPIRKALENTIFSTTLETILFGFLGYFLFIPTPEAKMCSFLCIVAIVGFLPLSHGYISKGLSHHSISKWGKYTYGIYLIHIPILNIFTAYKLTQPFDNSPVLLGFLIFILSFLASLFLFHFVEEPGKKMIVKYFGTTS